MGKNVVFSIDPFSKLISLICSVLPYWTPHICQHRDLHLPITVIVDPSRS